MEEGALMLKVFFLIVPCREIADVSAAWPRCLLAWSRLRWETGFSLTLWLCVACPASDHTLVTASFGAWSSDGVNGLQWTELYSLVSMREGLGSHAVVTL